MARRSEEGWKTSWRNCVEGKSTQQRTAENGKESSHSVNDNEWMDGWMNNNNNNPNYLKYLLAGSGAYWPVPKTEQAQRENEETPRKAQKQEAQRSYHSSSQPVFLLSFTFTSPRYAFSLLLISRRYWLVRSSMLILINPLKFAKSTVKWQHELSLSA